MRREENGFLLALGVFAQVFHEQAPVAGVEPHREVVEYEQLGILRQDEPERHLGTLAAGHARNTLPRRHAELLHQAVVGVAVPARIELRIETFDLLDGHEGVLHMPFDEQGDARPRPGRHRADVFAEDQALAGTGPEVTAQDVDRGGLTGAVLTQKSEDPPARNLETQVFIDQPLPVIMGQVAAFDYGIRHGKVSS